MTDKERYTRLQEEVMNQQLKYQKEFEKFERENKELKKQLLLQREKLSGGKIRKIKVSFSKKKKKKNFFSKGPPLRFFYCHDKILFFFILEIID
jgi:hypothetical protein